MALLPSTRRGDAGLQAAIGAGNRWRSWRCNSGGIEKCPSSADFSASLFACSSTKHAPPHFQAEYAEHRAVINIRTLELIEGKLPRRALELVLDWAELHQDELLADWDLCQQHQQPDAIDPLN